MQYLELEKRAALWSQRKLGAHIDETEELAGTFIIDEPVIFMFHDEATYHANMCELKVWKEKNRTSKQLLQKSQGQGNLLSAFVYETDGFIELTSQQVQQVNERCTNAGKQPISGKNAIRQITVGSAHDGYWTGEDQLLRTDEVIDMFETKHPSKKGVFIFDNSAGHMKHPIDDIRIDKMALNWGGKGESMRSTTLQEACGRFQKGDV